MPSFKSLETRMIAPLKYGYPISQAPVQEVPYDGGHLASFYFRHGVGISNMRSALRASRVGSVFDLETGTSLIIPNEDN